MTVLMLIASLPMYAFAEDLHDLFTADATSEGEQSATDPTVGKGTYELTDRRTETVKHFRLSDGSYVAVQYDTAVHYQDADGDWQDIDNTLSDTGSEYDAKSGSIKFAKNTNAAKTVSIKGDGYKLSFGLMDAQKSKVAVISNTTERDTTKVQGYQELSTLTKLISKVTYPDAYENVDVEYVLFGNSIKENIVVKQGGADAYAFSFEMQVNNLVAELKTDGSIVLCLSDTDEVVYTIPAPFMYDAAGVYSNDVAYTLDQKNKNKYVVTVTANSAWINATERSFPVVIDPTCSIGTSGSVCYTESTYVGSDDPDTNHSTENVMLVGRNGDGFSTFALNKISTLVNIPEHAIIVDAKLKLFTPSPVDGVRIGVSQVTTPWESSTVTYNTKPSYSDIILDYQTLKTGTKTYRWDITTLVRGWAEGTIDNDGLALVLVDSTTLGSYVRFYTMVYGSPGYRPTYEITYRDTKGVEDYYNYYSSSADGAGTGYINAFTGNLAFSHSGNSTTDAIFPYTFSLTYNAALAGTPVTTENALTPITSSPTGHGFKLGCDETLVYRIVPGSEYHYIWSDSDGTEHYFRSQKFTVNGTSQTRYCDEDGLQLYVDQEKDASNVLTGYMISDDAGNKKHFNTAGYMDYVQDVNGNKRIFNRDADNLVVSIALLPNGSTQEIEQLAFEYIGGVLSTVTNIQTGLVANYYYSETYNGTTLTQTGGYLRKITYVYSNDSTYSVAFDYDSNGRMLLAKDLKTGIAVGYTYDEKGRVITTTGYANANESNSNLTVGQTAGITYGVNKTTYRSAGNNDVYGDADDIYTIYHFDHSGKVTSAYTHDGVDIYGAGNYVYEAEDSVKTKNAVSTDMTVGGISINHLRNGGFDNNGTATTPSEWTSTGNIFFSGQNGDGNDNLYVGMRLDASNINAKLKQTVTLTPDTYTFSIYCMRAHITETTQLKLVVYQGNTSTMLAISTPALAYDSDYPLSGIWERMSIPFTLTTAGEVTLSIEFSNQTTTYVSSSLVYVDSAMLEKSAGASTYSMIGNGGFEQSNTTWSLKNAMRQNAEKWDGTYGIKVTGWAEDTAYAKTTLQFVYDNALDPEGIICEMAKPVRFVLSGYAKANSVATVNPNTLGSNADKAPIFALKAVFHYYETDFTSVQYVPFDPHVTDWQFASGVITSEPDETGFCNYVTSVDIYFCYDYNENTAYFDNISAMRNADSVTVYSYNDLGNLEGEESSDGNGTGYTYDENEIDVSEAETTEGNKYQAEYDDKHRPTVTFDVNGTNHYKTSYEYDAYGNVVSTKTQEVDVTTPRGMTISSTIATNTAYFGAMLTETDATGGVGRYFYNSKAQLVGICDANGSGMIYTYNAYGQLTGASVATYNASTNSMVLANTGTVVNGYNNKGGIESIDNGSSRYTFVYDAFGNTTQIAVNGESLVEYEYRTGNGKLLSMTYGNGASAAYIYDGVDRVVGVCYNGSEETTFTYSYNANGNLAEHYNARENITYTYNYDASGKLLQTTAKQAGETVYAVQNQYDDFGRQTAVYYYYTDTPAAPLTLTQYSYDEIGNLTKVTLAGASAHINYTFDSLGRLSKKQLANTFDPTIGVTYDYIYRTHGSANGITKTSGQISQVVTNDNLGVQTVSYTYDANGYITEARTMQGTTEVSLYSYVYDNKGQLVRENRYFPATSYLCKTITFTYDNAGNLLYKRTYSYTTGSLDGLTYSQITYGYLADTETVDNRNDLLVSYGGNAITYDAMGNPLTYGTDYFFTWDGRQLTQFRQLYQWSDGFQNITEEYIYTYTYNADGIRTSKVVNGVLHEYVVDGTKIVREKIYNTAGTYITKDLRYYYDAEGNPCAIRQFTLNSAGTVTGDVIYYLGTNLQGDVVAIYNEAGERLYTYEYDAWGTVVRATQVATGGYNAAAANPFRYRGYYYDTETGYYYLSSRYYNPQWGRFINADEPAVVAASPNSFTDKNLYAYCDNNPVMRSDEEGDLWGLLLKAAIGVANKYVGDVIGNIMDGKTGADIFKPTSSIGEYVAAGVTAILPGSGVAGALLSNVVEEGILVVEAKIKGDEVNVGNSVMNVVKGTVTDVLVEKATDKVTDFIQSKAPKNYSTFAHKVRKKTPNLSRQEIYPKLRRARTINGVMQKTAARGIQFAASLLPSF